MQELHTYSSPIPQFPSPTTKLLEQNTLTYQADKQFFKITMAFNCLHIPEPISPLCWDVSPGAALLNHFIISLPPHLISPWPAQKHSSRVCSLIWSGKKGFFVFFFFLLIFPPNKRYMGKIISKINLVFATGTQVFSTLPHWHPSSLTAQWGNNLENDSPSFLSSLSSYRKTDWDIRLVPITPMSCHGRPRGGRDKLKMLNTGKPQKKLWKARGHQRKEENTFYSIHVPSTHLVK